MQKPKIAHPGKPHRWVGTASPLFDRCCITGCHAMRRYVNGAWIEPNDDQPKATTTATAVAQQPDLWA